ncbi:hypothetical protein R3P38DRAFT_3173951 [Favolaschia claudopus]|uniref:DUF6697 domain-containing protein n=1 Tax=Favolaschia claudopus TaxID=2862362 RepID=A0AAW0DGW2_9AGAR
MRASGSPPAERKVKIELQTPSTRKQAVYDLGASCSSTVLQEMLQEREYKILDLEKQNLRLKEKRSRDTATIRELEAELRLTRAKNSNVKAEKTCNMQPSSNIRASRGAESAITVIDSDEDEEPAKRIRHKNSLARSNSSSGEGGNAPAPSDFVVEGLDADDEQPENDTSSTQSRNELPATTSVGTRTSSTNDLQQGDDSSDADVQVKDEVIDVVIKTEGEPDYFTRVTLIKSEDGRFDIWNVDGFGLGPTIDVDERYNRGFSRKVISDAFGGGWMVCYHHWKSKPVKGDIGPFLTFNRSWNNALPASPGVHGIGFFNMNGCPTSPEPVNVFVGEGSNDWRLLGTYDYLRWGEIASHHVSLLPAGVLNNWVNGMLGSQWGKSWIDDTNKGLSPARKIKLSVEHVLDALKDGRMHIPFTILKCVGYPKDWFEKLLYYEAHPKPQSEANSRKRKAPDQLQKPRKKGAAVRGNGKRKVKEETSSEDSDEHSTHEDEEEEFGSDDDSDFVVGNQPMARLPTRSSPRKAVQSQRSRIPSPEF